MLYWISSLLIVLSASLASAQASQEAATTFNSYCQDKKQIKAMRESFIAKIQSAPKGLPIDEAQKIIATRKKNARTLAKTIYLTGYDERGSTNAATLETGRMSEGIEWFRDKRKINLAWYDLSTLKDLDQLRRHYTVMMPIKEQKKLFVSSKVESQYFSPNCSEYELLIGAVGYIGFDKSCRFSAKRAIFDAQRLFEVIGLRFTSISESPGKDPDSMNFVVSLDLSIVCAYGIPQDDLLSK